MAKFVGNVVDVIKSDGQAYHCLGSWGTSGIRLDVKFELGGKKEYARLDSFFRGRFGWLNKEVQSAIRKTAPQTITVSTRTRKVWVSYSQETGAVYRDEMLYIASRKDLREWLERTRICLQSKEQ